MPAHPTPCDPERLRRLLDDRLDEAEQAAMAGHLAACEGCRRTLDRMAAASDWWRDARAFLGDHGPDADATIHRPEPDDSLDFLAPSDDPAHLGRIGSYEVVDVIGRGGMGVVLKALDPSLNRFVAIKVLAPELATSASARRRFAREGQAAAAICHDHVVAIHAVDASGGLPFLVMQYVPGKSLQERIDRSGPLAVEEVVRIGMQAARGLEAAHAVGLIHRDVKPSNILLENGVERVKLVDFGLARAADDASLTQSGVVAGTPQYMAPEQAEGEPVDHRSDLFSLGSVLYALCTGRPPFRAESTMAVLRRVSDDTPRPIRELNPEVPDWLEAVIARLHAKDPARRFQTASEVAHLLGRCLAYLREPRRGDPPYPVDRAKKPRKRRLAIAAVGLLALIGLGAAGSDFVATVLRIRTPDGTMVIRVNDPDVKVKVDGEDVVITGAGPQELRVRPGMHTVEAAKGDRTKTEIVSVERGGKRSVEVGFEPGAELIAGPGQIRSGAATLKFDRIRVVSPGPAEAGRHEPEGQADAAPAASPRVAVTRNGRPIDARVTFTPTTPIATPPLMPWCSVKFRPVRPGTTEPDVDAPPAEPLAIAFAPDGKRVAVVGRIKADSGKEDAQARGLLGLFEPWKGTLRILATEPGEIDCVAFAPDGKTLATGQGIHEKRKLNEEIQPDYAAVSMRDAETGKVVHALPHRGRVDALAYSPDGTVLVTACRHGGIRLFDATSGRAYGSLPQATAKGGANAPADGLAFTPDARKLLVWSRSGPAWLRTPTPAGALRPDRVIRLTRDPVNFAGISADGNLVTATNTGAIVLQPLGSPGLVATLRDPGQPGHYTAFALSPDGKTLAAATAAPTEVPGKGQYRVEILDTSSRAHVADLEGLEARITSVAFASNGNDFAASAADGTVMMWDLTRVRSAEVARSADSRRPATPAPLASLPGLPGDALARPPVPPGPARAATREGRPTADRPVAEPFSTPEVARRPGPVLVSPRRAPVPGPRRAPEPVAPRDEPGGLTVGRRDLPGGALPEEEKKGSAVLTLAVSPDGKVFATGSEDGVVRILDAASQEVIRELREHAWPVRSLAFTPSPVPHQAAGPVGLVSAASDESGDRGGEIILWNLDRGALARNRRSDGPGKPVSSVAIAPDGKTLAIGTRGGAIELVDFPALTPSKDLRPCHQGKAVRVVAYSSDGKTLASGGDDGTVEVRSSDGTLRATLRGAGGITGLVFSPDGKSLAVASGRSATLYDLGQGVPVTSRSFALKQSDALAVAFSPDGKLLAVAGGNVHEEDEPTEVERKVLQLEKARVEMQRDVQHRRDALRAQQERLGHLDLQAMKDRSAVSIEEYRQLANSLLGVQIEIVKAEAQLAQLQAGQKKSAITESDLTRLFYGEKEVAETQERYEKAKDEYKTMQKTHRDLLAPPVQKALKEMQDAKAEMDRLWKEKMPRLEAMAREADPKAAGAPPEAPGGSLRAVEIQLAILKAQAVALAEKLNTLNIRQRSEGAGAATLEFERMDLARAESALDKINQNLTDLRLQQLGEDQPKRKAEGQSELRIWEVASGNLSRGLIEPGGWIRALAFARDGSVVIAGGGMPGEPGFVTLFDLAAPAEAPSRR